MSIENEIQTQVSDEVAAQVAAVQSEVVQAVQAAVSEEMTLEKIHALVQDTYNRVNSNSLDLSTLTDTVTQIMGLLVDMKESINALAIAEIAEIQNDLEEENEEEENPEPVEVAPENPGELAPEKFETVELPPVETKAKSKVKFIV